MSAPSSPKSRKSSPPAPRDPIPVPEPFTRRLTTAELLAGTPPREFLVDAILSAGTACVLGGPAGSLKTAVAVDLAVSLGSGEPVLDRFPVTHQVDVLYLSGEDDPYTLMDHVEATLGAKNCDDARVHWLYDLPDFHDDDAVAETCREIAACGAEVVVFDPLYLALAPGQPPDLTLNLCAVGPVLQRVSQACIAAGATPVFVQNTVRVPKHLQGPFMDRLDLAVPGVAEYARQWLLLGPPTWARRVAEGPRETRQRSVKGMAVFPGRREDRPERRPEAVSVAAVTGGSDGRRTEFVVRGYGIGTLTADPA